MVGWDTPEPIRSGRACKTYFVGSARRAENPLNSFVGSVKYMRCKCSVNEVKGVQQAAFHLNCSSRQLQRILNQYADSGIVTKIGKGSYRLNILEPHRPTLSGKQ